MNKLFQRIIFSNNSTPALNASNMNAISKALDDIDNRVIEGYTNAMQAGEILTECENYSNLALASATTAGETLTDVEAIKTDVEGLKSNVETTKSEVEGIAESAKTEVDGYVATASASIAESTSSAQTSADNAEASYQRTRAIEISLGHPLIPMGTVTFDNAPSLSEVEVGWMYNISNDFTTTADFEEGAGKDVSAGANIYKATSNKWDLFASPSVVLVDDTLSETSTNPISNKAITTEVNSLKKSVSDGKTLIANAITQAGGQSEATDTFSKMADSIGATCRDNYDAGVTATKKGTATASDVVSGKTFTSANGVNQSGSLTIYSATPSDTYPKSLSSGSTYKMASSGYAISSYSSVTPTADGAYFSSGMRLMSGSGYAYSSQPSGGKATWLWINSSPTSAFNAQTVSLSLSSYDYVIIEGIYYTTETGNYSKVLVPKGASNLRCAFTSNSSNTKNSSRIVSVSSTGVTFSTGYSSTGGTGTSYAVPQRIWGINPF